MIEDEGRAPRYGRICRFSRDSICDANSTGLGRIGIDGVGPPRGEKARPRLPFWRDSDGDGLCSGAGGGLEEPRQAITTTSFCQPRTLSVTGCDRARSHWEARKMPPPTSRAVTTPDQNPSPLAALTRARHWTRSSSMDRSTSSIFATKASVSARSRATPSISASRSARRTRMVPSNALPSPAVISNRSEDVTRTLANDGVEFISQNQHVKRHHRAARFLMCRCHLLVGFGPRSCYP